MLNYTKSELYRVSHTREVYLIAGLLAVLVVLMNIGTAFLGGRYATTSFSYSNLVANPMAFAVMGAIVAYVLYEGGRKNGNLKNTVASGISRSKIFAGECVVSVICATLVMFLTITVWVVSAELLIEGDGPVKLKDFLLEVPAVYLIAVAGLISSIVFLEVFEKNITAILLWLVIWFFLPKGLMYLGMRFAPMAQIALWIPENFFGINTLHVNTTECITVWDTAAGWFRCVLSGAVGIVLFVSAGIALLRRRDL